LTIVNLNKTGSHDWNSSIRNIICSNGCTVVVLRFRARCNFERKFRVQISGIMSHQKTSGVSTRKSLAKVTPITFLTLIPFKTENVPRSIFPVWNLRSEIACIESILTVVHCFIMVKGIQLINSTLRYRFTISCAKSKPLK